MYQETITYLAPRSRSSRLRREAQKSGIEERRTNYNLKVARELFTNGNVGNVTPETAPVMGSSQPITPVHLDIAPVPVEVKVFSPLPPDPNAIAAHAQDMQRELNKPGDSRLNARISNGEIQLCVKPAPSLDAQNSRSNRHFE